MTTNQFIIIIFSFIFFFSTFSKDMIIQTTAAYKLWQRTGIKPEEVRAARCPNWKSSYEEYKKRERRNKTKVFYYP